MIEDKGQYVFTGHQLRRPERKMREIWTKLMEVLERSELNPADEHEKVVYDAIHKAASVADQLADYHRERYEQDGE